MTYLSRLCAFLSAALLLSIAFSPVPTQAQEAPFITIWDTENQGGTDDDQIEIPGTGTDYQVIWEEVGNTSNRDTLTATDEVTITFPNPGLYRVKISGDFTRIHFGDGGDINKIIQVGQWGDIQWSTMEEAFTRSELFEGASNLELTANDTPNLSDVTSMGRMFEGASSLTASSSNIGQWDVSSVTEMFYMFRRASSFNADLSAWDVSNVTNMNTMFEGASSFNADLSSWDVSSVTNMRGMFSGASSFNADLSSWDVSNVTDMFVMFEGASSFNADLSAWDVSNLANAGSMFDGSNLSAENYDRILIGWAWRDLQDDVTLGADGVELCDGGPFRIHMVNAFGWLVGGSDQNGCPDDLEASGASQVSSDGTFAFGEVGLAVTFAELIGGDRFTTARYSEAPRNVEGISEANVSQYRTIIAGGGISFFDSADLEFAVNAFVGIDQPDDIKIYNRSHPGHGPFNSLPTSVDDNGTPDNISDDTLSATITSSSGEDGFGEFVLASDTNPLAVRLIGVAPETVDFGTIAVGDTTTETVTISSNGEAALEGNVGLKATESPYFLQEGEGDFNLETGNTLDVVVGYTQEEVSSLDQDTLSITHTGDSTDSPVEVPLEGAAEAASPTVQLADPASVTTSSVDLSGTVNPGGDTTDAAFEYRETDASIFEDLPAEESPLTDASDQSVSVTATGLSPDTEHEVRLVATNGAGADTSALKSFTTEAVGLAIEEGGTGGLDRAFEAVPGEADQPVGTFRLAADTSGTVLDSLSVTTQASESTSGVNQVALWASPDDTLETSADAQLATRGVSDETGFPSKIAFSGLADSVSGDDRHYFVTVSLSSDGQGAVTGLLANESVMKLDGGQIESVNGSDQAEFSDLPLSSEASLLPVEMAGFDGTATEGGARLTWKTASETNNAGFEVQRQKEEQWTQVGYVESKAEGGTTTETQSYSFAAEDLPVGTHQFRLKQVDLDGSSTLIDPVSVTIDMQEALKLTAPAPNPASVTATLSFAVKEQGETTIRLYNTLGQQVATVYEGTPQAGEEQTARMDVSGLSSGTYFLQLSADGRTETRRVTVVR